MSFTWLSCIAELLGDVACAYVREDFRGVNELAERLLSGFTIGHNVATKKRKKKTRTNYKHFSCDRKLK